MPIPSNGPVDIAAVNVEVGLPAERSSTLSFLNGYLKSPAATPNMGAFLGTAYYQRNVDGNCNNGNCFNSGSGNGNCTPVINGGNGNCSNQGGPNGNCAENCNCGNIQCRNCFIAGPSDCGNCQVCNAINCGNCTVCTPVNCGNCQVCAGINCNNCDPQPYLQPNCNCSGGYNCSTFGVSYNCSTAGYTVNCSTSGVSYNCVAGATSYNCNCACNCSKIICTKLHEFGMMPYSIFAADQQYGEWLKKNDKVVYRGYIRWAKTVTAWMDGTGPNFMFWVNKEIRNQKQKESTIKWAYKIATPWSEHMAYLMGAVKNDNEVGKILMNIGRPICKFVFSLPKEYKLGLFGSWMMWFLCLGSYFYATTYVKTINKLSKIKTNLKTKLIQGFSK